MPNTILHDVVLKSLNLIPQAPDHNGVLAFGPCMGLLEELHSTDVWGLPFILVREVVRWCQFLMLIWCGTRSVFTNCWYSTLGSCILGQGFGLFSGSVFLAPESSGSIHNGSPGQRECGVVHRGLFISVYLVMITFIRGFCQMVALLHCQGLSQFPIHHFTRCCLGNLCIILIYIMSRVGEHGNFLEVNRENQP